MKIIGLSAPIGGGKDTAANFYLKNYPRIRHFKFAHAVQDVVAVFCGFYKEDLTHRIRFDDSEWKNKGHAITLGDKVYTPRDLLKLIATEAFRNVFGENVWVYKLENDIVQTLKDDEVAVISDVRFPSEIDWVNRIGGQPVYISNPVAMENMVKAGLHLHASEQHHEYLLDNSNVVVDNSGDFWNFYDQLHNVFENYVRHDKYD